MSHPSLLEKEVSQTMMVVVSAGRWLNILLPGGPFLIQHCGFHRARTSLVLGDEWDLELPFKPFFFFFFLGKSKSHHSQGQTPLETSEHELHSHRLPHEAILAAPRFWETFWGLPQGSKSPIQKKITIPEGSPLWHWVGFAAPTSADRPSSMHACTHVYVLAVLTRHPFKKRPCG